MNKEIQELLNKCKNCKLNECIGCEFTYSDIQKINKYINNLESKLNKVTDKLKEDANKKIPLAEDMDWVRCRKEHAKEILNIIEGEKE